PVSQPAGRELDPSAVEVGFRHTSRPIDSDAKRKLERRRIASERVLRSLYFRLDVVALDHDWNADPALLETGACGTCRKQEERSLRPKQVRHAHRAELGAVE